MSKVDTWHPINGKWVHIFQEDRGTASTFYYTDGEFVAQESSHDMGKVLRPITKPSKEYQDFDKHETAGKPDPLERLVINKPCEFNAPPYARTIISCLEKHSPQTAAKYRMLIDEGRKAPCWIVRQIVLKLLLSKESVINLP